MGLTNLSGVILLSNDGASEYFQVCITPKTPAAHKME